MQHGVLHKLVARHANERLDAGGSQRLTERKRFSSRGRGDPLATAEQKQLEALTHEVSADSVVPKEMMRRELATAVAARRAQLRDPREA